MTEPLLSTDKYNEFEKVSKYLTDYRNFEAEVDKNVGSMQSADEVKGLVTPINSKTYWLKNSLDSKDAKSASRYAKELRELFDPFVQKFSNHPDAKKVIEESSALLQRFDKEVGAIVKGNANKFSSN